MKKIKRRKQFVNIYYQCDVCKKKYFSACEAINCEKSHTCKHEPIFEFTAASKDSWWFNVRGITLTCKFCKKDLGCVDFEDVEDNEDVIKAIYNIVKQHNQSLQPTTKSSDDLD